MSYQNYSEKHKRSVSPILKTTTEDRKMLHHNKENYILYLEQQLEKTATVVHRKYEERVKGLEQLIQDHDDKLKNFIKLIKLLQNFAETQEQENNKIIRHVNSKYEELYHNELRTINKQLHEVQYKVELLETVQIKDQSPLFEQFEQSVNRKIDVLMSEIGQSALKTDYQILEQRLVKLEETAISPKMYQESDNKHNVLVEQQLSDLKFLLDNVLKEQETLKTNVQNFHQDLNQQKISASTLPPRESRKSIIRESRQSEDESIMKPINAQPSPNKTLSKKKPVTDRSTSNKKDKKEKKQGKSTTQQKKNSNSVLKRKK